MNSFEDIIMYGDGQYEVRVVSGERKINTF